MECPPDKEVVKMQTTPEVKEQRKLKICDFSVGEKAKIIRSLDNFSVVNLGEFEIAAKESKKFT